MLETFGKNYYIDIDGVSEKCRISTDRKDEEGNEIIEFNVFKYELLKMCIDRLLYESEGVDEEMGVYDSSLTPSYKIAYNTLIKNEILIDDNLIDDDE